MTNLPLDVARAHAQEVVAGHADSHSDGAADELHVFPVGSIIDWYGTLVNGQPPFRNWRLADGTVTLPDGTKPPDLRDRLTIGAGNTYALGANVLVASAALQLTAVAVYKIIRIR